MAAPAAQEQTDAPSLPTPPLTGRCQCGQISYVVNAAPVNFNICHCLECQLQTSAAFGMSLHVPAAALILTFPTLASQDTLPGHTTSDTISTTSFKTPAGTSTPHTTTLTLREAVALSATTSLPDGSTQQKHPALGRFDRATESGGIRGGMFCKACGVRIVHYDVEDLSGAVSLKAGTLDAACKVDARAAVHVWERRMVRGVRGMLAEQRVPGAREGVREVWAEEEGEGSVLYC